MLPVRGDRLGAAASSRLPALCLLASLLAAVSLWATICKDRHSATFLVQQQPHWRRLYGRDAGASADTASAATSGSPLASAVAVAAAATATFAVAAPLRRGAGARIAGGRKEALGLPLRLRSRGVACLCASPAVSGSAIARSAAAAGTLEAPPALEGVEADEDQGSAGSAGPGGAGEPKGSGSGGPNALRRMWTSADAWHVHAVSGAFHIGIGVIYLLDIVIGDFVRLAGGTWSAHVSIEVVLASMVFGAVNALTGLQPRLLPGKIENLPQVMGFGPNGNLKSGGFINTAIFYFILTYQSLRPMESYPAVLEPLDHVFGLVTLLTIAHTIYIISGWVERAGLSRLFGVAMSAPLLLNVPVSLHLLAEAGNWVSAMSTAYCGWPEVFFVSNYALAWAGSMVTFILSLYERKVITLSERLWLVVAMGAVTFTVVPLEAYLKIPQWFAGEQMVMLTLTPPM